jgi:hypothetical protein
MTSPRHRHSSLPIANVQPPHRTGMVNFLLTVLILTGPFLERLLGLPVPDLVDAVSTLATSAAGLRFAILKLDAGARWVSGKVAPRLAPPLIRLHLLTLEWFYAGQHRQ